MSLRWIYLVIRTFVFLIMAQDSVQSLNSLYIQLTTLLKNIKQISEYDIIPSDDKSQDALIVDGDKLGIYKWCIKPLYGHAYQRFKECRGKKSNMTYEETDELTKCLLLFHADHMTSWNARKELVANGFLSIETDLHFAQLVVQMHPKSSETFIHRRWLIDCILPSLTDSQKRDLAVKECQICNRAALKYANNYYAWTHRIWCLDTFQCQSDRTFLLQELSGATQFCDVHISEFSGFHYKQYLFSLLCTNQSWKESFAMIEEELKCNSDMIKFYPNHESLWIYRRSLIHLYLRTPNKNASVLYGQQQTIVKAAFATLFDRELDYGSNVMDSSSCAWQKEVCQRYTRWLAMMKNKL